MVSFRGQLHDTGFACRNIEFDRLRNHVSLSREREGGGGGGGVTLSEDIIPERHMFISCQVNLVPCNYLKFLVFV